MRIGTKIAIQFLRNIKMNKHQIEKLIEGADRAIVAEDFESLMATYTDDALLVVEPGRNAVGKQEIADAFKKIAKYFDYGLQVEQNGMQILETKDTALVLANTLVSGPNFPTEERKATYVFKKMEDGNWLCAIDNSYGHTIIEYSA